MIDPFDYKEPQCPLCGGEEFYGAERRARSVPIMNITEKLDSFFSKEDYRGAKKLLEYWLTEAREIGDERGELSLCPRSWDCRAASESTNGEWMRCTAERSFAAVSVSQRAYRVRRCF